MSNFTCQFVIPATIAAMTTIVATTFTSYLLARPWCIEIAPDASQRIVYGQTNCSDQIKPWPHRLPPVQGASANVDGINNYQ